jgi:hypothetical protein
MGVNSTEVAYNFGQMGSIYVGGTTGVKSNNVTDDPGVGANAVFVAITFVTDTVFDSADAGLISETNQLFPSTQYTSTNISTDGGAVVDSVTFPAGITIYGRWIGFKLASGSVIAYIGY